MPNVLIKCACGCGAGFPERDKSGRRRRFVSGHNTTPELARKHRAALTSKPDAKEKLSRAGRKAWSDPAYRQRMAESVQRQWADPEFRGKVLTAAHEGARRNWQDPDYRARMVESGKVSARKYLNSPEVRKRSDRERSLRMKELWRNPEWIAKIKATHANQCGTVRKSKPEQSLHLFLSSIGIPFESNRRFVLDRGYTMPDAFFTDLNLAVFTDGTYWHGKPEKKQRDREQRAALSTLGVSVFVIDQGQPEEPQFDALARNIAELCPA